MSFKIVPNDKKLLKSSKVRAWLRYVENKIQEELDSSWISISDEYECCPLTGIIRKKSIKES